MSSVISLEKVSVNYMAGKTQIVAGLAPVTVTLGNTQVTSIVGRSGCGKSSLLRAIAQLVPYLGSISIDSKPTIKITQDVLYVPQIPVLFPWLTVQRNITFGLIRQGMSKADANERATSILNETGLANLQSRWPNELSGGQAQRISLARAFVLDPSVLLLDEPFSQLDAITKNDWYHTLSKMINARPELKVVLVTHDIHEAFTLSSELIVLVRHQATSNAYPFVSHASTLSKDVSKDDIFNSVCSLLNIT